MNRTKPRPVYRRSVPFDLQIIEAQITLGTVVAEEIPGLAWNALEAGFDAPNICKVAPPVNPLLRGKDVPFSLFDKPQP